MKKDFATAIITAIIGFIAAFLIMSNLILGDPKPISIKTLGSTSSATVDQPNIEIFNYRAVNPTVESYVDCTNYDLSGNCIKNDEEEPEEEPEEEEEEEPEEEE